MSETTPVNGDLVRVLKQALAIAESGKLFVGAIVAFGPRHLHVTTAIPRREDVVTMIAELSLLRTQLQLNTIAEREQRVAQQPNIIKANSLNG